MLPGPLDPDVEGFQVPHVPLGILRVVIPVRDVPLAKEQVRLLEFPGPNRAVRPGRFQPVGFGCVKGQGRPAVAVVEALDGVTLAVPARVIADSTRSRIVHRVAVWGVGEDVPGVVGNDVEDHVHPLLVGGLDEFAELRARPEMWVDVEEVLDAVAVVSRLKRDLPEDGADPEGGDAKPPKVAELAPQPVERAPLPAAACAKPGVVIDRTGVLGPVERRDAGAYRLSLVVPMAVLLPAIGETVYEQEIQDLVLPGGRGRGERPPCQGGEVEFQQAYLDSFGHRCTDPGRSLIQSGGPQTAWFTHAAGRCGSRGRRSVRPGSCARSRARPRWPAGSRKTVHCPAAGRASGPRSS